MLHWLKKKSLFEKLPSMGLSLFLIVNLGMVIFYSFVAFKIQLGTDSSTKVLLANEILTRGEFLPHGWCYANNDVWVFFNHIFLLPFIKLFGLNYFSYALNNLSFYLIYWGAIYYFLRSLVLSTSMKLFIAILAISSLSNCYCRILFGQIAYIPSYLFIFLFLGIMQKFLTVRDHELKKYYLAIFVLLFAFGIHNPQRALIYNFLPVWFVLFYLYFIKNDRRKRFGVATLVSLGAFLLAVALFYSVITKDLTLIRSSNNILFASFDSVLEHIRIFFAGLLETFNLANLEEFSPYHLGGVRRLLSFPFFVLIVYSLYRTHKAKDRIKTDALMVYLLFLCYLAIPLFLYIFTHPLAQDQSSFRYFYPAVLCSFLGLAFFLENVRWKQPVKKAVLIGAVLFLSASNFTHYVKPAFSGSQNSHEYLAQYLDKNDLTYGFATYWHSYVVTVLAEKDALVAPVYFTDFVPMLWLSSKDWYHGRGAEKTFIVFTKAEFEQYCKNVFAKIGRPPLYIDDVGDFKIAVFETKGGASLL